LVAPIADPSWETDNKEVAKILKEESERLLEEAIMKLACLGACDQGFDIHRHLRAKALATISPVKIRKVKKYEEETVPGETDQKLVNALKKWRNAKANEANVAPYMIISVKAIEQLAAKKPDNKKELLKVKGIGKKKAESFGPEIIEIIGSHKQTLL
jgi:superfamily II DNA helicase RecQ